MEEVLFLSSNGFPLLCLIVALVLMAIMDSTRGYDFYAGGRDGWVLYPSESYSHWAERNRFQFSSSKGEDSVLVVAEHDFYACNFGKPLRQLNGGNDRFTFDHSGPFFFVSGAPGKCELVQKLLLMVMAIRHWPPPSSPQPSGNAPVSDASGSWPSPAPAPAELPATSDAAISS